MSNLYRFAELFTKQNRPFVFQDEVLWVEYQKMVQPFGKINFNYQISSSLSKKLFQKFSKSILVRCTNGIKDKPNQWFAVGCKIFTPLELYKAKDKRKIKKGLETYRIEIISGKQLAEEGYETFINAFQRYKNIAAPQLSKTDFYNAHILYNEFPDIVHCWGVFNENKMVGFAINFVFDKDEVNYSSMKFIPEDLKNYASYGLIYSMNKYYLSDLKIALVNDGFRSILHETNIQNFLIQEFKFEKIYCPLAIKFKAPFNFAMKIIFPFRKILKQFHPKLNALISLQELAK